MRSHRREMVSPAADERFAPPLQPQDPVSFAADPACVQKAVENGFAHASINKRGQNALQSNEFKLFTLSHTNNTETFVFGMDGASDSHDQGLSGYVINGLFVYLKEDALIWNIAITIQFDDISPYHVPEMPLGLFCGHGERNSTKGPVAIGWDTNLGMCVVTMPMPFRKTCKVVLSYTEASGEAPDVQLSVFANVSSHELEFSFQYFSAQYTSSAATEVCHGQHVHHAARVPKGSSGKLVGIHFFSDFHVLNLEGTHVIQWDGLKGSGLLGLGVEDIFNLFAYFQADGTEQREAFHGAIETRACAKAYVQRERSPFTKAACENALGTSRKSKERWNTFGKGVGNSAYRHFILDPIIFHDGMHYYVQMGQNVGIPNHGLWRPSPRQCDEAFGGMKTVVFLYIDDMHTRQWTIENIVETTIKSQEILSAWQPKPNAPLERPLMTRTVKSTYHEDLSRVPLSIKYRILPRGYCDVITISDMSWAGRGRIVVRRSYLSSFLGAQTAAVHTAEGIYGYWSSALLRNPYEEHAEDEFIIDYNAPKKKYMQATNFSLVICPIENASWTSSSYQVFWRGHQPRS